MAGRLVPGDANRVNGPRQLGFATFLAVVALGCSLLPAGRTAVTIPAREGVKELPVVLDDPGGLVEAVDDAHVEYGDPDFGVLAAKRSDDHSAVVTWLGGACDDRARVRVIARDATIAIRVETDEKVGLGCTAVGIPRSVTITFREPLGDRSVALDRGG